MGLIFDGAHRGTPESAWSASDRLRAVPAIDMRRARERSWWLPTPTTRCLGPVGWWTTHRSCLLRCCGASSAATRSTSWA
jgi:hypothetical protein